MPDDTVHTLAADLFLRAAEAPPETRDVLLDAEPNREVAEAARELLHGHLDTTGPLDAPLIARRASGADGRVGQRVGPWQLEAVLGHGGMGVVYRATRADGAYEREVALKLLHAGPDTAGLAARLRAERQILARLEHPRIARLYDGGVTDDGRARGAPYLVMELVRGEPATAYAERHGLSVRERVELAVAVCEGVAYAHQRLVVHRDLKPSNILVASGEAGEGAKGQGGGEGGTTARGEEPRSPSSPIPIPTVKLLDFGIAKLLGDEASGDLTRTHAELTPAYAAPEQVTGGEVTTATDVYALGVLLYELLAGKRPYSLSGTTAAEAERVITQTTPPVPSAVAPEARRRALHGDLDVIVMKALEKEPERRYQGADALGADLRRWMDGLAIEARPATAAYRVGRFVRRHRALTLAGAVALLAVVGGAALALWQAREARAEAAKAEAMQTFLVGMLGAANPETGDGRDVRVADLLDRAAGDVDSTFAGQPEVQVTAREHLGSTYYELGLLDEAVAQFRRGLALAGRVYGPGDLETARLQSYLGTALRDLAEYAAADSLYALSLATHRRRAGEVDARTAEVLAEIGTLRYYAGDYDGSAEAHERVLAIEEAVLPPGDPEIVLTIGNLGVARSAQGRDAEALALFERQVGLLREIEPPEPITLANALANLGTSYFSAGRREDAARVQREAVALFRETLGGEHPSTAFGLSNLGSTLTALGRPTEAEPLLRESAAVYREASGARHPNVGFPLVNLAKALRDLGRLDEAERAAREAGDLFREGFGADHPVMERVTETLASIDERR